MTVTSYKDSKDSQSDDNVDADGDGDGDDTTLVDTGNNTNDKDKDEHDAFVDEDEDGDYPYRKKQRRRRRCSARTIWTASCGIGCSLVVVVTLVVVGLSITIITNDNPTFFYGHNQNSTAQQNSNNESPSPSTNDRRPRCYESSFDENRLKNPCSFSNNQQAPDVFELIWPTNRYGTFTMNCVRDRAPVQVDRVYHLARFGYYGYNYFLRVIPNKYIQFGTNGLPTISNVYNWSSMSSFLTPSEKECQSSVIFPQPPEMQRCMANQNLSLDCRSTTTTTATSATTTQTQTSSSPATVGLSNTFGTVSMSTSYNETYSSTQYGDFTKYGGVTWNATAELFINIGHNNQHLDQNLFVPICSIDRQEEMDDVVLKFPTFGELSDFGGGGDGPSLGLLYELGNEYIESNPVWNQSMAQSTRITICE